jgi:radical SAM family protein/B12 binding protein
LADRFFADSSKPLSLFLLESAVKVALILCPYWDAKWPISSLAILSAQLKRQGHEAKIFDLNKSMSLLDQAQDCKIARRGSTLLEPDENADYADYVKTQIIPANRQSFVSIADHILSAGFEAVGFSVFHQNLPMTLEIAEIFKQRNPNVRIVFGGPAFLRYPDGLKNVDSRRVDAVVFGEGDLSFPRLIDGLERAGRLQPGPGVLLLDDPAAWKDGPETVANLDELPYGDFSDYDLRFYGGKSINTARGCVKRCVFCSEWSGIAYRHMSGRRLFDEVVHQLRRDPAKTDFNFAGPLINGSMKELSAFCDLIIANGIRLSWSSFAIVRPEMTRGFLTKLRSAGCKELLYGIESGSAKVLRDMDKHVKPALAAQVLRDTTAAGIETIVQWIVGFPTESDEDFQESVDFVLANGDGITNLCVNMFLGGEMLDEFDSYGIEPGEDHRFWRTRDGRNTFPIRLKRMRQLIESAAERGVDATYRNIPSPNMPRLEEEFTQAYRRHMESRTR